MHSGPAARRIISGPRTSSVPTGAAQSVAVMAAGSAPAGAVLETRASTVTLTGRKRLAWALALGRCTSSYVTTVAPPAPCVVTGLV